VLHSRLYSEITTKSYSSLQN